MARITNPGAGARNPGLRFDWLKQLDERVRGLPAGSNWLEDSELAPQRCRLFIMARFPELPRPFSDKVLSLALSLGEKKITDSDGADRILRGLDAGQRSQLAGLLQDATEALEAHTRYGLTSKMVHDLAAKTKRRTDMQHRKVGKIRRELESLREYANRQIPLLGLDYIHAADRGLKALANVKDDPSRGEFYLSLKSEYPRLQDPRQLGIAEFYWFFRNECRCSGRESEVRVAMIANAFLDCKLKYKSKYRDAESQGCSAVRIAVSRYRPRTTG